MSPITQLTVAVVIPCYNAERTVARAIASVKSQDHAANEIIVVNDGSNDRSVEKIRELHSDVHITTIPNSGACRARNTGLAQIKSEYILFLDADDQIAGDHLGAGSKIAKNHQADVVLCAMLMRTEDRFFDFRDNLPQSLDNRIIFEKWLDGIQVNPSAMMWRTEFIRSIGGWNERTLIQQDGELMLRALLNQARVVRNPHGYGIYYRDGSSSISSAKTALKDKSYIEMLAQILNAASESEFAGYTQGIRKALYKAARTAFLNGQFDLGRQAIKALKDDAPIHHHGTVRHRLLSTIFGLELKTKLWRR